MKVRTIARLAGIACAACLTTTIATAQAPPFVGVWRSQTTMTGAGGYAVVVYIEDVFQPDGNFSSLSNSKYGNGPAAGGQIGAIHATGTYTVDPGQRIISFHNTTFESTQHTPAPEAEYDRYQFISPTMFTLQSLTGGPVLTFQRAQ